MIRIASTPWLRHRAELHAVQVLAGAPHRVLRALVGPWVAPALSLRLPTPSGLTGLVRDLGGRLVVANPNVAARLPREVAALARAVLGARLAGTLGALAEAPRGARREGPALGANDHLDARDAADRRRIAALLARLPEPARAALLAEAPMRWVATALFEPPSIDVQLVDPGGDTPTSPARFVAAIRYRLLLAAGADEPPGWEALLQADGASASAIAWPPARDDVPWYVTSLLVPDALAAGDMDGTTLARWGELTGRAGPSSRDRYWFADSWERYREPGRLVGHVTPQLVSRSRRPGGGGARLGDIALTPDVERGTAVPPGYCLVDCAGLLEVVLLTS